MVFSSSAFAQAPGQVRADLSQAHKWYIKIPPRGQHSSGLAQTPSAQKFNSVAGIDSLVNFTGDFEAPGFDPKGNPQSHWLWAMIGNPPEKGGLTTVDAPIVPVEVDLLDDNGDVRVINGHPLVYAPTVFLDKVLKSPVFSQAKFSSSDKPTQITDAIQRAEFFNRMKPG